MEVGIADLKARLSEHLRAVRRGRTLTVVDRKIPIARIVPLEVDSPLLMRRATRKPSDLVLPEPSTDSTDSLTALLDDRASR